MTRILYIIDSKARVDKFIQYIKRTALGEALAFYICPITIDSDIVNAVREKLAEYAQVTVLPFIAKFHENGFSYKDKFIKFLADFSSNRNSGAASLRNYFSYPFADFSVWWFSSIAEKNTAKNNTYHNFIKLMTILDFQEKCRANEVYVDIQDNGLKKSILRNKGDKKLTVAVKPKNKTGINLIIYFIKALGYFIFFIITKIILRFISGGSIKRRKSLMADAKFLMVTFFPFSTDTGLLKKKIFNNKVYGPLQESLEKSHKDKIAWLAMEKEYSGWNIKDIKLAKKINSWGYNLFLREELITLGQMAIAFSAFLIISLKFFIKIPYISRNFIFGNEKKVNLWDIFAEEWIYSFCGSNLIGGLCYYHIFSNMLAARKEPVVVIYPAELQWWESALNIARGQNKKVTTVGIQHSSVPFLFLSYFNYPADLNCKDNFNTFPLPDYLATSGNIPSKLLVDSGWPKRKIFDIGAIKYHRLLKFLDQEIAWNKREKKVVVALSIIHEEIKEMLLMLKQSFRNENTYNFVIKAHPATIQIRDFIKASGIDTFGNKFILDTHTPIENLLISSRAIIVVSSTASLDAVACQCPVVIPRLSCRVDMNPLSNVAEDLVRYADTQDEFRAVIGSIAGSEKSPIEFSKCKSFFNDYFTIVGNEDEYFERLQRQISN